MTPLEERIQAVKIAYAITKTISDDCSYYRPPTFDDRSEKVLEVARFLVDEEYDGNPPLDFDGDPLSPSRIAEIFRRDEAS